MKQSAEGSPCKDSGALILLSEDVDDLRCLLKTSLEYLGHQVIAAADAAGALEIANDNRGGIDLHITDVNLPGMDGGELHRLVLERSPNAKCILMSACPVTLLKGGAPDGSLFIQKPVGLGELVTKLQEAMSCE